MTSAIKFTQADADAAVLNPWYPWSSPTNVTKAANSLEPTGQCNKSTHTYTITDFLLNNQYPIESVGYVGHTSLYTAYMKPPDEFRATSTIVSTNDDNAWSNVSKNGAQPPHMFMMDDERFYKMPLGIKNITSHGLNYTDGQIQCIAKLVDPPGYTSIGVVTGGATGGEEGDARSCFNNSDTFCTASNMCGLTPLQDPATAWGSGKPNYPTFLPPAIHNSLVYVIKDVVVSGYSHLVITSVKDATQKFALYQQNDFAFNYIVNEATSGNVNVYIPITFLDIKLVCQHSNEFIKNHIPDRWKPYENIIDDLISHIRANTDCSFFTGPSGTPAVPGGGGSADSPISEQHALNKTIIFAVAGIVLFVVIVILYNYYK